MKKMQTLLAAVLAVSASASQATVIDFNDAPEIFRTDTYDTNGYHFEVFNPAGNQHMGLHTIPSTFYNSNGTPNLYTNTNDNNVSGFTMSRGGEHFSLMAFDYGNGYRSGRNNPEMFIVLGTAGLGVTVSAVINHYTKGIYTYNFGPGWDNLTSVQFLAYGADNIAMYDNIIVGEAVTAVPEPSSIAMLGIGLAGLMLLRRRT